MEWALSIYLLGCFNSFCLLHLHNKRQPVNHRKFELSVALLLSALSWLMAVIALSIIVSETDWWYGINKKFMGEESE